MEVGKIIHKLLFSQGPHVSGPTSHLTVKEDAHDAAWIILTSAVANLGNCCPPSEKVPIFDNAASP